MSKEEKIKNYLINYGFCYLCLHKDCYPTNRVCKNGINFYSRHNNNEDRPNNKI